MNIACSAEPCPVILNSTCVFYQGGNLIYTGINTNDSIQTALQKIDAKFQDAGLGYVFQNGVIQSSPGGPVKLGGSLTQNTIINSGGFTFKFTGTLESQAFITTGGTSSQFVKGDGSLDSTSYQPSGNYITALTGDATASGPGSAVITLANTGVIANTYGSNSQVPVITVDAKGRVTNVNNTSINYPPQLLFFSGDVGGAGQTGANVTLTLNNVNASPFGSITPLKFAVNAKGLVTGAAPLTNLDIFALIGYTPVPQTRTLTINGQTYDLSANRTWTVSTLPSQTGNAGKYLKTDGTNASWQTVDALPSQTGNSGKFLTTNGSIASWQNLPPSGVTSVGLSMPSAFTVTNSPVTSSGTLTVTGAGTASQYIRGDGQLATLPSSPSGGGSSISYYLNGSVPSSVVGYEQMSRNPVIGGGTNYSTSTDGLIAQFLTDAGDPSLLNIPGGNWLIDFYFSASSAGGSPSFYVELYKYNGVVFTLIASNSTSPEVITNGTSLDLYTTSIAVPTTTLALTDRLAIRVYVACDTRTITLYTEGVNLSQILTTFSTGLSALNGLIAQVQFLATGTTGTDFNISSVTNTHTFNLPVASATNTGKLSSTDWSTFNSKQNALTFGNFTESTSSVLTITGGTGAVIGSGTSVEVKQASGSQSGFLSSTDWNTFNDKPTTFYQNTQPTGTGTSAIVLESFWTHSDTGLQYTYIYDGNTYQWVQATLPLGPQGPQGANGTNTINGSTATTFNGLLKGNGATISATSVTAELGFTPENVANKENVTLDTSSTKYPTNNLVKTNLDNFANDVDYAIMTNQRILFNF
jgi:hypothetical protein